MQLKFTKKKKWMVIQKPMSKKLIKEMERKLLLMQRTVFEWTCAIHKVTWESGSLTQSIDYQKKQWEKYNANKIQKTKRKSATAKLRH